MYEIEYCDIYSCIYIVEFLVPFREQLFDV